MENKKDHKLIAEIVRLTKANTELEERVEELNMEVLQLKAKLYDMMTGAAQ